MNLNLKPQTQIKVEVEVKLSSVRDKEQAQTALQSMASDLSLNELERLAKAVKDPIKKAFALKYI